MSRHDMARLTAKPTTKRKTLAALTKTRLTLKNQLRPQNINGYTYINVGHTNLSDAGFKHLMQRGVTRSLVFVHDVIPLDHPQFQTPQSVARFEQRFTAVKHHADDVLTSSQATAASIRNYLNDAGPRVTVAPFGTNTQTQPRQPAKKPPLFVCIGTIEPRKNHTLLLEIWSELSKLPAPPHLHIVGRRGWLNEDVFHTLDTAPFMGKTVFERGYLTDAQISDLLSRATALLFPSHAEGFGLPLLEAMAHQTPIICTDLPVFKELGGPVPVYIEPNDRHKWVQKITNLVSRLETSSSSVPNRDRLNFPSWDDHFARVSAVLLG